jgi:nicotinamide riboside kinase
MEIDAPWVADGVRDRGHMREDMQALFRAAVQQTGVPYETISGTWNERFEKAKAAIDRLLSS